MKELLLKELSELARMGIRRTDHAVESVRNGDLDAHIDGWNSSVTELADLVLELAA